MQYVYNQNTISTKVFHFIYGCAMHDAILQRAFAGRKDWVRNVEAAASHLREYLDCVLDSRFSSREDHDACFLKTANEICSAINGSRPSDAEDVFSFGNAQKLINMAVKHTYSICYDSPALRDRFRYCHCPMDSVMLTKVWKSYKDSMGADRRKEKLKSAEFFCKSWGSEGQQGDHQPQIHEFPERYDAFQAAIRELIGEDGLYPVEFDYLVWE